MARKNSEQINERYVCSKYYTDRLSGSPLMYRNEKEEFYLVGVKSSYWCEGYENLHNRVSFYMDFIKENAKDVCFKKLEMSKNPHTKISNLQWLQMQLVKN